MYRTCNILNMPLRKNITQNSHLLDLHPQQVSNKTLQFLYMKAIYHLKYTNMPFCLFNIPCCYTFKP